MADSPTSTQDYLVKALYGIGAFASGILGYRKFGAARASGQSEEIRLLRQRVALMEQKLNAATKLVEELQDSVNSSESRQRRIELRLADIQREMRDKITELTESMDRVAELIRQRQSGHPVS